MSKGRIAACLMLAMALTLASAAGAQSNVRIRGTIASVDDKGLVVKSRDGRDVTVKLPDNVAVTVPVVVRFEDIKPGDYLGTTTKTGTDGVPVALDIHYIPPTAAEGNTPSDQGGGAVMTNAKVGAVVQTKVSREMTVELKGGPQKIKVPADVPIVRAVPGTRADLVAGEQVIIVGQPAPDGAVTALRVQVGKNGVKPL